MATTTTKKEATEEVVKETKPVETKAAKSDNLDAKMANLTDLMSQFVQVMMANQAARTEVRTPEDKIVIVHLAQTDPQLGTTIHLSNTEIGMTEFGEEDNSRYSSSKNCFRNTEAGSLRDFCVWRTDTKRRLKNMV